MTGIRRGGPRQVFCPVGFTTMSSRKDPGPEIFSLREIARAAGADVADVRALIAETDPRDAAGGFVRFDAAARLVRTLRSRATDAVPRPVLFASPARAPRPRPGPFAASGAIHAGMLGIMVLVAGLGVGTTPTQTRVQEPAHLVFLATPGPGGGGGGGGLRMPRPAPRARLRGPSRSKSPVTVARKAESDEPEERVETPPPPPPEPRPDPPPPPARSEPIPPVSAPVVSAPGDEADRAGVVADAPPAAPSHGPGEGGGIGSGRGTGSGEGDGAGIGPGSTAGIGGGPYRPGSGITPPSLLHEVKPVYTDEGRRRSVEGEVVMEVVVRADGSVGQVRVLQGLGSGLNERAADAVRQWRFAPARRFGQPVDVLVEVAVEFRLR
jgi:TonB family protein